MHLAAVLTVALAACKGAPATPPPKPPPPAATTGVVTPRTMDAPTLARWLVEPSERLRVVNFWATWCEPCITEMPVLKDLARRHPDVDLVLVNIDQRAVQGPRVAQMRRNLGIEHLSMVLLDAADPNADLRASVPGWPEEIPWTLVLAPDGRIVARFVQGVSGPEVEAALAQASTAVADPG